MLLLDPGHGGRDKGAQGYGITESEYVLEFCQILEQEVMSIDGAPEVALTRSHDQDMSLAERGRKAAQLGAELTISVHVNAAKDAMLHGGLAFYWPGNNVAEMVSKCILAAYPPMLRSMIPGGVETDKDEWKSRARNVVSAYPKTAVLLELGYCSHRHDAAELRTNVIREHLLVATLAGILAWMRHVDHG